MDSLAALAEVAVRAARAGGAVVAEAGGGDASPARAKGAGDYVTETDLASERLVREVLAGTGVPVLGEEAGGLRGGAEGTYWAVDPLDGTTNFLHRFPAVGVSVALVADGTPEAGAVYAPFLRRTWVAWRGGGAWAGEERLRVSSRSPATAVVGTGFPFRRKENVGRYLEAFRAAFSRFEDLRRPGAAALDLAWVAEGVFDGFFELGLGTWDVAAGAVLIREAGGLVTDWEGDAEAWLVTGNVLAGPPAIHEALLEVAVGTSGGGGEPGGGGRPGPGDSSVD